MTAPKALRSLYGASDRLKANTAKAHIGAGKDRPQEVYTPQPIVDALLKLWPEGIAFDPCSGPNSIVTAEECLYGEQVPTGRVDKEGNPILHWIGPGLTAKLRPRTYQNPPYKTLEDWIAELLEHGIEEAEGELVTLYPYRAQRPWFRDYLAATTRVCLLNTIPFHGYEQAAPFPLILSYHGDRDFDSACEGLGGMVSFEF